MLLVEFIKPFGLRQAETTGRLGISTNRLNEVVLVKRRTTADTVLRLLRLLKSSPQFWMRLRPTGTCTEQPTRLIEMITQYVY